MAEKDTPGISVEADGINEIKIGSNATIICLKAGENIKLSVPEDDPNYNKNVRWIWIAAEYLEEAKKILPGQVFDKWGRWNKRRKKPRINIDKYGINKQYGITKKLTSAVSKQSDLENGSIYYYEPFINAPTLENGYYVATVDEPKILSAYFARYKDEFKYPGESGTSNVYTYKNTIKLYVLGHLLPDYTVGYHNFVLFEVDIWDTDGTKVTEKPMKFVQKYSAGTLSINTMTELDFVIDEKWRDTSKHKSDTIKTYYAKIKTIIYSNEKAFAGKEVDKIKENHLITPNENHNTEWFTNKFIAVAPNQDIIGVTYTDEDEKVSNSLEIEILFGLMSYNPGRHVSEGKKHAQKYTKTLVEEDYDTSKGTVLKDQEVSFQVKYDTMDVILDNYEVNKNNMMVVVGDVDYTNKRNEPCKYSKIEISHKSRKEPFVIFDEDSKTSVPKDRTNLAFGFVAGDKKEIVTITAHGLAIQNYQDKGLKKPKCYGITVARMPKKGRMVYKAVKHRDDEEFKHNSIEDVFSMNKAYVLFPDHRIPTTSPNKGTTGSETLDISKQQIKYTHKDNYIELEVGYIYNKTYDTQAEKWLGDTAGNWTNDLIDIAWIVRYFKLSDALAQKYFVPISTCRYPSQTAVIKVFPDVKWWINIKWGAENPKYVHQSPNYKYRKFTTKPHQNLNSRKAYLEQRKKTKDNSYKVGIDTGFTYNGKKVNFDSGQGFPLINFVNFVVKAYTLFRKITFADETSIGEDEIRDNKVFSSRKSKAKEMTTRYKYRKSKGLPISIKVLRPSFSAGVAGYYAQSKYDNNAYGGMYEAIFSAKPLFGVEGKLDLLYFAQFIGPIGKALDALSKVIKRIDLLTCGAVKIDFFLNLCAKVELNVSTGVSYHSLDGWEGEFQAVLPIKVWVEAGVMVDVSIKGVASADADAIMKGEANMDLQLTLDKRNNKLPMQFTFSGLDLKVWISLKGTSHKKGGSKKNSEKPEEGAKEPAGEPTHKKRLLDPEKPVIFNIL